MYFMHSGMSVPARLKIICMGPQSYTIGKAISPFLSDRVTYVQVYTLKLISGQTVEQA